MGTQSLKHVIIADFLDEAEVETPVLGDVARITLAKAWNEAELAPALETADAVLLFHDIPYMGENAFRNAPKCRVVTRAGVGFNNVDLAAAGREGILVCNVPDYGSEEVADHAMMFLLAITRQLRPSDLSIRSGVWDYRSAYSAIRLRGQVLGIVGCGRIGTAMALRAKAFGLDVVFYDPNAPRGLDKSLGVRRVESLEVLMRQSRFVSLHCWLDEESRHIINARTIGLMSPGGVIINTARGPVVEADDLVEALNSGHLLGAGLDVFETEPFNHEALRNHPKVLLTPHSAFYSQESFVELRRKAAEEVRRVLLDESPWNLVNRSYLCAKPRARIS